MNKNNSTALVEVSRGGAARIWVLTWILTQLLPIESTLYESQVYLFCNLSRAHTLKSDLLINMMAQPCPGLALTPLAPPGLESLGFAEHGALKGCCLRSPLICPPGSRKNSRPVNITSWGPNCICSSSWAHLTNVC